MHQLKVFCVASWYISAATLAGWVASLPRVRSALEPRAGWQGAALTRTGMSAEFRELSYI